ncbi:hypothetical protein [Duffyella gerundensis]|uniref:hypothetical protein n=1 Tax=Duffyella gerundensis TaxID=1619313 RepID=UPI0021F6B47B|nr:hypothetical protein [Duffyella gerundensis]
MPHYCFYKKARHVVVLASSDATSAEPLLQQGYEKQFEEVSALNADRALRRFADIRRDKRTDQHNFLAGAATFPLIGVLTAFAMFLLKKKAGRK